MISEDRDMKSMLWEVGLRLDIVEKKQQSMLKMLQNSRNFAKSSRSTDDNRSKIEEKKFAAKKAKSVEIFVNISSSDDEYVSKLHHQKKMVPEVAAANVCKNPKRSYTWRNEDYTSITDTIMVPDPEHYRKGSEQSISSPNLSRTSCGNSRALRNFEEVIYCSNKLWLEDKKPAQTEDR
ncbi:unnamed protein product [Gongylonema pulchrum]|uniref:Ovule protein n=1 Tax=Gongylonema pulchrum TaxID=637853 RepID=A0A183ETG7_9BILA|nr:unnamed protein product [Gongylonema pulchrum]